MAYFTAIKVKIQTLTLQSKIKTLLVNIHIGFILFVGTLSMIFTCNSAYFENYLINFFYFVDLNFKYYTKKVVLWVRLE